MRCWPESINTSTYSAKQVRIFGGDFVRAISESTEDARDVARTLAKTEAFEQSCRNRKRVEMLFAHLKQACGLTV
jgi:hypothetical protein